MNFNHVNYLWDDAKAASLGDDQIALFLYRSNILGADLRITNYGGGNTSCKTIEKDPLSGKEVEVMWVKGSGGDIGTLTRKGIAGLYVEKLQQLKNRYRGIEFEDEIVGLQLHCLFDLDSAAPSIDTPLHGLLPFKHIDHLHPDAVIAIAAAKDSPAVTREIWGDTMGWVPWQRPGFDLGLQLEKCLAENPGIRGIVLGGHGLFTWGDTSKACYLNSLEVIEQASAYIERHLGKKRPVFGGAKVQSMDAGARKKQAAAIAPVLRGFCSSERMMIGHFTDDARVLEFINSNDLAKLAPLGTSCPDHFLRTKIQPLVLSMASDANLADVEEVKKALQPAFEQYRAEYAAYYDTCKHPHSPAMRDPNPVVMLYPGVGMFTFAKDKQTARVAAEFYINAINVMRGSEAITEYTALPRQEAFNIEYWLLEEAKLQRMPKPKPLSGRVALVTGSGGGIGLATAKKLATEGACVVLNDIDEQRLEDAKAEFVKTFGKDSVSTTPLNVTDADAVAAAFDAACLAFGGVDVVVSNAGISISKGLLEHSLSDWDKLQNILVKGQFLVSQAGVAVMRKQGFGGDVVNIVSKNAVVAGPNNVGYGAAKAAQAHMTRLLAAELGGDHIRVNMVNPDAVIAGSNIWAGGWAEGRAKAYGVSVEELPAFYAKRTLLGAIILPDDIANAVFVLVSGLLNKSTGNALNVDGGVAMGFLR
ncbi:MAG TPA: bifunctional aldolase/short-chain dehydrogenase [Saprospiraceae bacterium]|nr:bifunctional aldolase/short-chain dehydrogenase [Saprospiraceae bacterium]HMQ83334.1 bifunctional aldolase/short-chain dehydrogenase [Saprospiraceae bacterium]